MPNKALVRMTFCHCTVQSLYAEITRTMKIIKSDGMTPTERLLADLCDRTFLKLWSYPNPFKEDKNELRRKQGYPLCSTNR